MIPSFSCLLCTDLDRTLIPNGPEPVSPGAEDALRRVLSESGMGLVFVTGRDADLVREAIREYDLITPDLVIADVGASIFSVKENGKGNEWTRVKDWDNRLSADWQIKTAMEIAPLLTDIPDLTLQAANRQGRHKLSFTLPLTIHPDSSPVQGQGAESASIAGRIRAALEKQGIRFTLIYSVDHDAGCGLLDVLPVSADKEKAIRYLLDVAGLPLDRCLFSGDSGNDLAVFDSPVPSVLVANADDATRNAVRKLAERPDRQDTIHIASGGFLGMNGNYAAGILEGINRFFPKATHLLTREYGVKNA